MGDSSVVQGPLIHQQNVFSVTRTFSMTPSQKCLQTIWPHRDVVESCIYLFWSIGVTNGWVQQSGFWNLFSGIMPGPLMGSWLGLLLVPRLMLLSCSVCFKKKRTVESFHSSHATAGEALLCVNWKAPRHTNKICSQIWKLQAKQPCSQLIRWGQSSPDIMLTVL